MSITEKTTLPELAAIVSRALEKSGIQAVLTGGAAVVVWTQGGQQSFDLDFISTARRSELLAVMSELGFTPKGKDYVHPETPFFVEFPTGPLAVGGSLAGEDDVVLKRTRRGVIRIISPTFSVMDRLAQYFHWSDRSALDQAVAVAQKHPIDTKKVSDWAEREAMKDKYELFLTLLEKQSRP